MELRQLGNSGLYVSKLMLGTMTLGQADESSMFHGIGCPEAEAFTIIDAAIESGINCIDTANVYGQDGMVEKLLGKYFMERKNRKNIILATKFRFGMGPLSHQKGASRLHIMDAIEQSLQRLKTDYIDLYQIHMQDINTPEDETLRALDDLVRQGKVRYIGASNYAAYRFLDALYTSGKNMARYCSLQMQYSLVCRDIEREHIPLSLKHGVGILAWSPLAGGFLSGKYGPNLSASPEARFSQKHDWGTRFDTSHNWTVLNCLKALAVELGCTPSQLALAWLLQKRAVSSVIIGARKISQLTDNLASATVNVPLEMIKMLDEKSALPSVYPYNFIASKQGSW